MQKKVVGHGIQAESTRGIHGMVQVARYLPGVAVEAKTLDNHRHLLNVRNGTLDLMTFQLRAHDPKDMLTRRIEAPYKPTARPFGSAPRQASRSVASA